jgi:hypothetical protein
MCLPISCPASVAIGKASEGEEEKIVRRSLVKREITQLALPVLVAFVSAYDIAVQHATLANLLGLTFGSIGAGIAIGRFTERRRSEKSAGRVPGAGQGPNT